MRGLQHISDGGVSANSNYTYSSAEVGAYYLFVCSRTDNLIELTVSGANIIGTSKYTGGNGDGACSAYLVKATSTTIVFTNTHSYHYNFAYNFSKVL